MDIASFFQTYVVEMIRSLPPAARFATIGALTGWGIGYIVFTILSALQFNIARLEAKLKINSKKKSRKKSKSNGISTSSGNIIVHPIMKSEVTIEDFYGISEVNWPLLAAFATMIGAAIALAVSTDPFVDTIMYGGIGAFAVYGVRMYIIYTRKLTVQKHAIDTLDLLANEIYAQNNSLSMALASLKKNYFEQYDLYKSKSYFYNNTVLSRLVYLVAVSASYAPPLSLINKLADELESIDAMKRVAGMVEARLASVGDAGPALRDAINSYYEDYAAERMEAIEGFGDKLYFPVMITHYFPLMIVIMWPLMEEITRMMSGNSLNPPSF